MFSLLKTDHVDVLKVLCEFPQPLVEKPKHWIVPVDGLSANEKSHLLSISRALPTYARALFQLFLAINTLQKVVILAGAEQKGDVLILHRL